MLDDDPELSIVIPIYREAANLPALLESVSSHVEPLVASYEIILVDDGSPDETWQEVERQAQRRPQLIGLRLSRNFGKESALCAGVERARGRAVVTMDGDLQHPPGIIPEMVELWRGGRAQVVEAIKRSRGGQSWWGRLSARLFYWVFKAFSGVELNRATDFKLLDRRVVDAWREMPERSLFFRGMVWWVGFARAQIAFDVPERESGESKWALTRLLGLALTAVSAFSAVPLQLATLTGLLFLLFAFGLGLQTVYLKLSGQAVSGFATVILLILLTGSLVLLCLGVIGQYIARIYDEVKGRPRYVVAEEAAGAPATGVARD